MLCRGTVFNSGKNASKAFISITSGNAGADLPVAEKVQCFCTEHHVPHREAMYVALCLEEMAGNIVNHGFRAGKGSHMIDIRVILKEDGKICTVVRDDCIPFNPVEWAQITTGGDPEENIGIRMVLKIASDVSYQNLLGLNVLSIVLAPGTAA